MDFFRTFALQHGEISSVGRAPDCGSGCRGFEPHIAPQLKREEAGQKVPFWPASGFLPPLLRSCPRGRCGLHFVPTGDFRRSQCSLLRRVPDGTATQNLSTPAAPCSRMLLAQHTRTAGRVEIRLLLLLEILSIFEDYLENYGT